jgi:ribosomal protein S18 acetylase RimI-like enzyme
MPDLALSAAVIRQLLPADAALYRAFRLAALAESPEAFGSDHATESAAPVENFAATLGGGYVAGAFLDGRLVATAGFRRLDREKTRHRGDIWGVYVAPDARSAGVGRRVMEHLLAHARARVQQVHLCVTAGNGAAIALYDRLGFVRYGTDPRALLVNGRYLDEYLMVLRFD